MIQPDKIRQIQARQAEIMQAMSDPDIATDPKKMAELGREHQTLKQVSEAFERVEALKKEVEELREMINDDNDPELVEIAREELREAEEQLPKAEEDLIMQLIPRDPEDSKDAIIEIRAGTGGDEASLFAGDLYRMYTRFAEKNGWKTELLDASVGTVGGFKEIVFSLHGNEAYGMMRYESGVHRVQRVPATESSGRIHTSAATVAVLPEAEDVDVQINENDLKVDVYRSSGPGGQSVNTTDSAVRITHIPTGIVVSIQDEKSQHKNKDKALRVLRSRLYEIELEKQHAERSEARKSMVGSGDRSAKIRTYNWPQGRVTDHRLTGDLKNHPLQAIMGGDLDDIIRALSMADHAEQLANL